jgi:uncharacterized membrane protein
MNQRYCWAFNARLQPQRSIVGGLYVSVLEPAIPRSAGNGLYQRSLHPLHAFLLGGTYCLLLGGTLSDWAYFSSHEIQWKNFAAWLIIGGLVLGGFTLLWELIHLFRAHLGLRAHMIYFLLLLAAWILGFINELIHAKDAWASMPDALILSVIMTALATAAAVVGFSTIRAGGR